MAYLVQNKSGYCFRLNVPSDLQGRVDLCGGGTLMPHLKAKGASLEILDQAIDTGTASGRAFLQMLGVFAEFETNLRKERQMAGIQRAKSRGVYKGRKPALTTAQHQEIRDKRKNGMNPTQLSREYQVSRATIYNVLKANSNGTPT